MKKHIKNWREISNEPNVKPVHDFLRKTLIDAKLGRIESADELLHNFVHDNTVLDIGVVGHTIERADDPRWKHNQIKKVATRVVGIDILEEPVLILQGRGFDIRLCDATSNTDIGERFNRIVIGDVIEHVDNPVALLRFAARHLEPGGRIMCTTPNPFYVGNILDIIRDGIFITNAEHVSWITPTMALELAHRADVRLHSYWHASGKGNTYFRRTMIGFLKLTKIINYDFFARSYIYIFERNQDQKV